MAALTYTTRRSIEKTGFTVVAKTDISVVAGNQFNSVAGDFLGMGFGQWIFVSGFFDATLNGWFQLDSDSTANDIVVSSTIPTVVAGDVITIIGYYRGLNQVNTFDLTFQQIDRQRLVIKNESKSLSGVTESLIQRREVYFNLETQLLDGALLKQVIEFLDSCDSGERFLFDEHGTVLLSNNPLQVRIDGNGYTEKRTGTYFKSIVFKIVSSA